MIQDSDVDTAIPEDYELGDFDDQLALHPLPGESTPVSLYIDYVRLSKLMSTILSQMYTTNSRRGGAEKIARLGRDLHVWHHALIDSLQLTSFEIGDFSRMARIPKLDRFSDSEQHMILWLELMANYAMVLVHRPALTFDPSTQQFGDSLTICVRSSTAIINLMDAVFMTGFGHSIAPFGPSIVFQSALMLIFHRYHVEAGVVGEGTDAAEPIAAVSRAVGILRNMALEFSGTAGSLEALQSPIDLLRSLAVLGTGSHRNVDGAAHSTASPRNTTPFADAAIPLVPETASNAGVLQTLNDIDAFNWYFGEPSSNSGCNSWEGIDFSPMPDEPDLQ